jgi:quaternary ammonium compound-resistance protein SugE
MTWVYLFAAGLCEVAWAMGLKFSEGFTRFAWSAWTIVLLIASFLLLARAVRDLPVGTAYPIWTGIGALGTAALGMLFLKEPPHLGRIACIVLIVIGIAGLRWFSPAPPA